MVGVVLAAIGKSRLLANKKFKQFEGKQQFFQFQKNLYVKSFFFSGLCDENLRPKADGPPTRSGDLQGFWDMMMLQVENIDAAFSEIQKCRENGWQVSSEANHHLNQILYVCFVVLETRSSKSSATKRQSPHKTSTNAISRCQREVK